MTIRVQKQDFEVQKEIDALVGHYPDAGAIVTFTGRVRGRDEKGPIREMFLEHYPAMTRKQLEKIEAEAKNRWDLADCLIIHRHGKLKPGEQIVLVITLSAHRGDAFEAASFLMDWLKTKAPFWKKEIYSDGAKWVTARKKDEAKAKSWEK